MLAVSFASYVAQNSQFKAQSYSIAKVGKKIKNYELKIIKCWYYLFESKFARFLEIIKFENAMPIFFGRLTL